VSTIFQVVGWIGITYDDRSAIVTSLESGADQPPNETVGAIAPRYVLGHDACGAGVGTADQALHTVRVLEQPGELAAPFDVHSQLPKSTSQHCLDLRLRGEQDEWKFGGGKVQVMKTPFDAPSIHMDPQRDLGEAALQQSVRNTKTAQYLHRAWLHRECRRPWPGLGSLLDDSDAGAQDSRLQCNRQAGRAGTHDKDFGVTHDRADAR
jgi:hypothetical protein